MPTIPPRSISVHFLALFFAHFQRLTALGGALHVLVDVSLFTKTVPAVRAAVRSQSEVNRFVMLGERSLVRKAFLAVGAVE